MNTIYSIFVEIWNVFGEMSFYLLFGFFLAGILSLFITPKTVEKHLGKKGIISVIKAAAFGVPLPLCSCSVIPVATSLKRSGATNGATTSFLISTPQTGIDSIFVTYALLGPVFAIFRPFAAIISGVIGGIFVDIFTDKINENHNKSNETCNNCYKPMNAKGKFLHVLHYAFVTLLNDISKPLLIGLIIAGAISVVLPSDFLSEIVGTGIQSMLVMLLLGVPTYVCATASIPIAAVLIAKGVAPGAVFVFLVVGPATNAATIATIWKVIGKSATFIYLATITITALVFGILLDFIFEITAKTVHHGMEWMVPTILNDISAVILLSLIIINTFYTYRIKKAGLHKSKSILKLTINGMTCNHCAETIKNELLNDPTIEDLQINLADKTALIYGDNLDIANIERKINKLGYNSKKSI